MLDQVYEDILELATRAAAEWKRMSFENETASMKPGRLLQAMALVGDITERFTPPPAAKPPQGLSRADMKRYLTIVASIPRQMIPEAAPVDDEVGFRADLVAVIVNEVSKLLTLMREQPAFVLSVDEGIAVFKASLKLPPRKRQAAEWDVSGLKIEDLLFLRACLLGAPIVGCVTDAMEEKRTAMRAARAAGRHPSTWEQYV